ncbi:Glycosyl hydrolase family 61 domain containing protein [Naviculisporaceae sp. PSN 640]
MKLFPAIFAAGACFQAANAVERPTSDDSVHYNKVVRGEMDAYNFYKPIPGFDEKLDRITRGHRTADERLLGSTPVKNLTSPDLTCGGGGTNPAPEYLFLEQTNYGMRLRLDGIFNTTTNKPTPFGESYKGVYQVWIAKPENVYTKPNPWLKLGYWGYDRAFYWRDDLEKRVWGSDVVKNYQGDVFFAIPWDIKGGRYVLRLELIDLSRADQRFDVDPTRGAEFHVVCLQIEIEYVEDNEDLGVHFWDIDSDDLGREVSRAAFPGSYSYGDPGIHFNLKMQDPESYVGPGGQYFVMHGARGLRPNFIKDVDTSFLHHPY